MSNREEMCSNYWRELRPLVCHQLQLTNAKDPKSEEIEKEIRNFYLYINGQGVFG
jgi:hypothetical protein